MAQHVRVEQVSEKRIQPHLVQARDVAERVDVHPGSVHGCGPHQRTRTFGQRIDPREELREVYEHAFETYERLVEAGVARELARSVIPVGAYTEFFWTVNARALMNFVSLRAAETAQREIRRYADAVEQFLAAKMPVTHAAFVAADRVAP